MGEGSWTAAPGYDFWWHLGHDTMITSEWGTPNMVENGVNPELLLAGKLRQRAARLGSQPRRHLQRLELGPEHQMVLELRPAHDPNETYGFVGVVTSLKDLSASVWMWHREGSGHNGTWRIDKVIEIPAEPAPPTICRPSSRVSAPRLRSSPTSTSRSTIDSSMSRASAQAS